MQLLGQSIDNLPVFLDPHLHEGAFQTQHRQQAAIIRHEDIVMHRLKAAIRAYGAAEYLGQGTNATVKAVCERFQHGYSPLLSTTC